MNPPRPTPEPAARVCAGCCAALTARHQRKYCSLPCMGRARRAVQIACATCGTDIAKTLASPGRRRRYCSRACYALSLALPPASLVCERCKTTVTASGKAGHELRRPGRRYCSLACANADQGFRDRERWEGDSKRRLFASTRVRATEGRAPRA